MMPLLFSAPYLTQFMDVSGAKLPIAESIKQRNVLIDQFFYDVGALTKSEFGRLVAETNLEGSILVVEPRDPFGKDRIRKFDDYEDLRAAPGKLLARFSIAGVGSSDIGAAALARNLADHYGEPVAAIVAGYGLVDVLSEGLGGWFVLGLSNYLMKVFHDLDAESRAVSRALRSQGNAIEEVKAQKVAATLTGSPDSTTLLRLFLDEDREIKTLLGHSKGCLSIAYAVQALALLGEAGALACDKAKRTRIITTGAAVDLPRGFNNIGQYLGALDSFGTMNSRGAGGFYDLWLNERICWIPNASHHLNTELPFHMSIRDVLQRDDSSKNRRPASDNPLASTTSRLEHF